MNHFTKEFVMDLFLDNDSISTMNRLVVAVANVINENNENIRMFNDVMTKQSCMLQTKIRTPKARPVIRQKKSFYEEIIMLYTDDDYINRFKMKKGTVQALIDMLKQNLEPGKLIDQLDKKVHMFLWLLTSDSSYNEVGKLFNLHKSSVSYIFNEIASLLTEQIYQFICWPSVEEQHRTRVKVNSHYSFPNCVGFIDACRFHIGPKRNRKTKTEIVLLQAVCNEYLMFTDIYVGDVGNVDKNKVYRESTLSNELKNFVDFENHILGDSQYKLRKNLITPFTSEELLTSEEMHFNEVHWKTRSYINLAFELLREKFKKLNHIDCSKRETVKMLICAACIVHNFVILHEGAPGIKTENVICEFGVNVDTKIVKTAIEKRQFLCNYVNYINSTENCLELKGNVQ